MEGTLRNTQSHHLWEEEIIGLVTHTKSVQNQIIWKVSNMNIGVAQGQSRLSAAETFVGPCI